MMGRLAVISLKAWCGLLLVLESSAAAASVARGGVIMQGAGAQYLTSNLGAWRSVQAGGALRLRGGGKKKDEKGGIKNCPQKATDNRLFIANLPAGLNDEGLFEAFEIFGEVEEARVRESPHPFPTADPHLCSSANSTGDGGRAVKSKPYISSGRESSISETLKPNA
jgi:hypothetical protein